MRNFLKVFLCLVVLTGIPVQADENVGDPDVNGRCKVAFPGERDRNSFYCIRSFGIFYDRHMAFPGCFATLGNALETMAEMDYCKKEPKRGKCKILFPNHRDMNGRFCYGPANYSVTYKGFMVENRCTSLNSALELLESSKFCEDTPEENL